MLLEFNSSSVDSSLVSLNRGVFSALTFTSEKEARISDWIIVVFQTALKLTIFK